MHWQSMTNRVFDLRFASLWLTHLSCMYVSSCLGGVTGPACRITDRDLRIAFGKCIPTMSKPSCVVAGVAKIRKHAVQHLKPMRKKVRRPKLVHSNAITTWIFGGPIASLSFGPL